MKSMTKRVQSSEEVPSSVRYADVQKRNLAIEVSLTTYRVLRMSSGRYLCLTGKENAVPDADRWHRHRESQQRDHEGQFHCLGRLGAHSATSSAFVLSTGETMTAV